MGLISVEGIKVYAYHGHLPEEGVLGGHFIVNVWVKVDIGQVKKTDRLEDTVDYVKIIDVVIEQMKTRCDMIEVPANRILNKILSLNKVISAKIELEKLQPPIDATFDKISITVKGENKKKQ